MARPQTKRTVNILKDYLLVMQDIPQLPDAEIQECLGLMRSGSPDARRRLKESYLPYALKWSVAFRGGALGFQQLIETANQALMDGLESFGNRPAAGLTGYLQRAVEQKLRAELKACV